ncbi:MAG: class I SAM-dependent methyltransferase [Candidatus Woesearchaeota archaeon]
MNQQERYYTLETQNINLNNLTVQGKILDIGGGGEGIIGQVLGDKIVSIDKLKEELEEAPEGPLKIVMDAKELKFISESFNSVTSFFTMMYIKNKYHKKVFKEIYRVLKPDGRFKLWDIKIPKYKGGKKDIFLVPLEINIGSKIITTTYGVLWSERKQNINYFLKLGKDIGFEVDNYNEQDDTFFINFKK